MKNKPKNAHIEAHVLREARKCKREWVNVCARGPHVHKIGLSGLVNVYPIWIPNVSRKCKSVAQHVCWRSF